MFALSLMMLVLTGMTVFYAESAWAPVVVKAFGGPKVPALMHRVAAGILLGVFFLHLVYMRDRASCRNCADLQVVRAELADAATGRT